MKDITFDVPNKVLVGPSAPLCPALLEHGFTQVCASVVIDLTR